MRVFALLVPLSLLLVSVPASASLPWVCAHPPRAFACAGEYEWGHEAPDCAITQYYVWVYSGTSSALYGMDCTETGYRAMGGGATLANTTAVGFRWQTTECFTIFVVEYLGYQWTEVPVCDAGAPPDVRWGNVGP